MVIKQTFLHLTRETQQNQQITVVIWDLDMHANNLVVNL